MARNSSGGRASLSDMESIFPIHALRVVSVLSYERTKALALLAMATPVEGPDARARAIEAARAGDLAAFESVMRQYERMVLVTALRLLGNIEDAKDASQEVFLRLYRNLGKVEASTNFSGWLYRVTVNVCHDMGRKRLASVPMEDA